MPAMSSPNLMYLSRRIPYRDYCFAMDVQQPTARQLQSRINTDITQLLQRFENIMATATVDNTSHTASAIETYQLDVESTALVRAAEDILALTRTMKETWLFGKLDVLGEDERDVRRREQLERDVQAVKSAIEAGSLSDMDK